MTGHGGWPMTVRARPRRQPVLRRHLLPRPAAARPAVLPAGAGRDGGGVARPRRRGTPRRRQPARAPQPAGGRRPPAPIGRGRRSTPPCDRWRGSSTRRRGGFGGAPKFPPSMVLEFLRRTRRGSERPGSADARRDARGDGPRRHLRPARRRLRALLRRPRLGGAALREDALRQRPAARRLRPAGAPRSATGSPARPPTSCSASCAPPRAASPPRSTPTARASRASSTSGRRPSWSRRSAQDDGAWAARVFEVTDGRHLRARRLDPAAAARPAGTTPSGWLDVRARLLAARDAAGPARRATTRWSPPGTAWRSPASATPALLLGRAGVRRRGRGRRASCWSATCTVASTAGCRAGLPGRRGRAGTAGVLEDHGCVASGFLSLLQATGDAVWLERARVAARRRAGPLPRRRRRLLRHRRRRRGAGRPAPRPVRQRQPVGALRDRARARRPTPRSPARAGTARPPRRRSRPSRPLAERAPRFAGWSLAAAAVDARRAGGDRGRRPARAPRATPSRPAARRRPARSWWSPTGRATTSRCWPAGPRSTAGPAAYVCRHQVCERPVTDPADLA